MYRMIVFALTAGALLSACSSPAPAPTPQQAAIVPSPTIAAVAPIAPAPAPEQPTLTRPPATFTPLPVVTANPAVFSYLWPAYLPEGLTVAPKESRVARDDELGAGAPGFFLVTFNSADNKQKIILGGGAVEPLTLQGDEREMTLDGREAVLVSSGDQRLVRFVTSPGQGSLFLLGINISEQDLLLSAESLLPVASKDMRDRVGQ
jgi:hypothetical protein